MIQPEQVVEAEWAEWYRISDMARAQRRFVICLRNDNCVDLEVRKVYPVLPDAAAAREGMLRVVDESGEDYLYPEEYFVPVEIPAAARKFLSMHLPA
jgi:hypothetical protein